MKRLLLLLVFVPCAFAQLGWQNLGTQTVLVGSTPKAGLQGILKDCPDGTRDYCNTAADTFGFAGLEDRIKAAQSGCTPDRIHNHMYCLGGGHTDYLGNQIYDYDLSTGVLTRITDPSPPPAGLTGHGTASQFTTDGKPMSTHTQQGIVYMPNEDCLYKWGIGVGPSAMVQRFGWWVCNLRTTPTWIQKAALPGQHPFRVVSGGTGCTNGLQALTFTNGGGTGATASVVVAGGVPTGWISLAVDSGSGSGFTSLPTTATVATCTGTVTITGGGSVSFGQIVDNSGDAEDMVWLDTSAGTESLLAIPLSVYALYRYTPSLDTGPGSSPYTLLTGLNDTEIPTDATCRTWGTNKIAFCAGPNQPGFGAVTAGIYKIDLNTYVTTNITGSTSGCSTFYNTAAPGWQYDSFVDKFTAYIMTGNSVVVFDPNTYVCTTVTYTGGPSSSGTTSLTGGYDSFSYFPSPLNYYVVLNNATTPMFKLVLNGTPPTITNPASAGAITSGTQNSAYTYTFAATGTTPITWSIPSGAPPTGVSLNTSTGTLSGTPSVSGTFNFTIQASNGYGSPATQNDSLTIAPVCLFATSPTGTLPAGKFGIPYSQTIPTVGCASPTCAVTAGSLPTGLTLTGGSCLISGTPTVPGLSTFTIGITDAQGNPSQSINLIILDGPGVIFPVTVGPQIPGR